VGGCGVSYANFLCGVVEPIVKHHAWVSLRRNVQSREIRGLDYAVKGEETVGKKMKAIIFTLINEPVS
jgi:hypothetical protein